MTGIVKMSDVGGQTNTLPRYLSMLAGDTAYNPSSFYSIATSTVTGSPASFITFSNIPQTYKSLELRVFQRDTFTSGIYCSQYIYFNGDTTGSYSQTNMYGTFSAIGYSVSSGATQNYAFAGFGMGAASPNPSTSFGYYQCQISNYSNSTRKTTINTTFGWGTNNQSQTNYSQWVGNLGDLYNKTDAITSITCVPTTAYAVGTVIALYGVI